MAKPIDQREREELCDLLLELGPDAPTLCAGWTTFDLASHLVLREHFKRWDDARMAAEKRKGFAATVARLRRGAPLVPWRLPQLRTLMNGTEYFIHHEDARRANGRGRRTDRPDLEALSWKMTGFVGRRVARAVAPFGLELIRPDGTRRHFGPTQAVAIKGEATELLLYLSGRRAVAQVVLDGPADAKAALEKTQLRL